MHAGKAVANGRDQANTEWEPWPHPCSQGRPPVAKLIKPKGPKGLVIGDIIKMDATLEEYFVFGLPNEMPIHVMDVPF